jgi:hypothetical protein
MGGMTLSPLVKRTSALRRIPLPGKLRYVRTHGFEGDVCAFELARSQSSPIMVEDTFGRAMSLLPGDVFLGTPGHRESNRILVGGVPKRGLAPGGLYWVLSDCGIVGELTSATGRARSFLARAKYLGTIAGEDGQAMTMKQFATPAPRRVSDHGAKIAVIVGTSAEVGKTTAGLTLLRGLLKKGFQTAVLKATGTSAIAEIASYQDYGADCVFDCVDFGLPSTYPSNRNDMVRVFDRALDTCLSIPAEALLIECGGDMLAANIPVFLRRLTRRRRRVKVVLAAPDAVGAFGGTQKLRDMGLSVDLITGPCTDTPAVRQRTQTLCKTLAVNLADTEED